MKQILVFMMVAFSLVFAPIVSNAEIGRFQISAVSADTYFILDTKTGFVYRCHKEKCQRVKAPNYHKK